MNRRFALALAEEAASEGGDAVFLVQDYHLSLVPQAAPRAGPGRDDLPLLAHLDRGADLPADAAHPDPRRGAAGDARRRRPRVPLPDVGGELPAVGAPAARGSRRPRPVADHRGRARGGRPDPPDLGRRTRDARGRGEPAGPRAPSGAEPLAQQQPPHPARRSARAHEEHRPRVPGLRAVPAAAPGVAGAGPVPRAALALSGGAARVPRLHRGVPRGGRADQRRARQAPAGRRSSFDCRTTTKVPSPPTASTTSCS